MHTIGFLSLPAVLLLILACHTEIVVSEEDEGWSNTNNPVVEGQDHSTEPTHDSENWNNGNHELNEHSNESPSQHDVSGEEHATNGITDSITEPGSHGWSDSLHTDSAVSHTEQTWKQEEHHNETTASSDGHGHGAEHHDPTPSGQWSTPSDSQSLTEHEVIDGNWSTDSGISHTASASITEHGHDGYTEGLGMDTTHSGDNDHHDHTASDTSNGHGVTSSDDHQGIPTTEPADGWRQDDSGTHTASSDHETHNSASPGPNSDASGWTNDHHSEDQGPSTMSIDETSHSPPHYDDPQYGGDSSPSPDFDQVTLGNDYGQIPEDEPDKEGEELVAACKRESNYQGDFQDPTESSPELKCFYACAMVKMDVMNEESGQMQVNVQTTDNLIDEAFGENSEMIEKYRNAVSSCDQEVQRGGDRCEYAFNFINCGIQKVQSG
ncbi:hypothetical protein GE061_019788 [Apolygus lucorum]|uniref:Uncharacterized protein n=1 Tax=Apolygus lucorum TaxID=248454 RepID=A0A6A4JTN9_APOLU|nr:hypothetical protein GE061_019788 [Apolygus lucorum]